MSDISDEMERQETAPGGLEKVSITEEQLQLIQRRCMEIQNLNEVPESLHKFNLRAAIFQFIQSGVLFYLASRSDTKWFWYTNYPSPEEDALSHPPMGPAPEAIAGFSILWYSPVFLFLSGVEHLASYIMKDTYIYYVERHQNPFRWAEYSLSASLMHVMVAQFAGVCDIHLLFLTFVLSAVTMQTGSVHEIVNAKARADGFPQTWLAFTISWCSHICVWFLIFNYFGMRLQGGSQPDFIWGIVIIMFLLDAGFGILFSLQWAKIPPYDDFINGEKGFIMLSFFAKTLLAWIAFGGVFRSY